ncbi:MFS transporter [Sphingomonas sp. PR090111-T3T-6A]|uniref:MFS transporter n=1 Tax=Sphingomonas sp. PR090111-T3T-6A TaxID=685778 RepID=UPI0003670B47|nr:MFS transporter [Sphingomonas sp. PR090111-T3T-6A]
MRQIASDGASGPPTGNAMALWATVLGSSVAMIDMTVINVALPAIAKGLGADAAGVQWTVNAFMLPLSALVLIGGALADAAGRKRIFLIGLALFTLASIACALSPTLGWLIAARVAQGVGAALLSPASLAILGADFDGEARAKAIGTWAAASAIAVAAGPIVGGWLVDAFGWRWVFALVVPPAAAAGVLAMIGIRGGRDARAPAPDWAGGALATVGLGLLIWGLTIATSGGRHASASIMGGLVAAAIFLWWERRRGDRAMVPLALFGTACFTALTALTFLLYAALSGVLLLLPYLLISSGWLASSAGMALLPLPVIMAAGSRLAGSLAERIGAHWMLTIGPAVAGAGFALMGTIPAQEIDFVVHVLPAMVLVGIGMTMAVAPLTTAVMAAVDQHHAGAASGFNSATARIGGMVAVSLLGLVLTGGGQGVSIGAFHAAALAAGAIAIIAGAAGWFSAPPTRA